MLMGSAIVAASTIITGSIGVGTAVSIALLTGPLGPIAFVLVGVCVYCTWRDALKRGIRESLGQIQGVLSNTVRDTQRQVVQAFNEYTTQLERGFRDFVTGTRDQIQAEHKRTMDAINDSRKQTSEAKKQKVDALKAKTDQGTGLIHRIQTMLNPDA